MKRAKQRTPIQVVLVRYVRQQMAKRIRRHLRPLHGEVICDALNRRAVAEIREAVRQPIERITITPAIF